MDAVAEYPINASNARELQAKSVESKRRKKLATQIALQTGANLQLNPIHARILGKLDDLELDWMNAKPRERTAIAQAYATFYGLLFPKPRPSRGTNRQSAPSVIETPVETPQDNPANPAKT